MKMGVQAGTPSGHFKQSTGHCSEQHVPNPVADSLSEMNDCKMQVSWEE